MVLPELLPLFPLPDHVLLPGLPCPFQLFEPRYRELGAFLAGQADDQRWLAVPRLLDGAGVDGLPPFARIAAIARARQLALLPDGRWSLVIEGFARVTLSEQPSPHRFRLARPVLRPDGPDVPETATLLARLRQLIGRLAERLGERGEPLLRLITHDEPALLVDRLGALLLVDPDHRQALLEDADIAARIRRLLRVLGGERPGSAEPSLN